MSKDVLNQFAQEMLKLLQNVDKFTMEQLPLVAREVLAFNMARSLFYSALGLVLLVVTGVLVKKAIPLAKQDNDLCMAFFLPALVTLIVGCALFFNNFGNVLEIHFAPRMFLLEYFKHFIS